MNDKEKQIEEMAKFMHYKAHGKDKDCDNEKCEMCWCSCKNDAEALYNAGYRKLPEDSVVLSKGAYESLSSKAKANVVNAVEIRKETAEKIFQKIKIKVLIEDINEDRPQTLYRFTSFDVMKMAREIVEEFGVVFENGRATVEIKE